MPDNNPELLRKGTIDIRSPGEVEMWCEALDLWVADLVHAVDVVGNDAPRVIEFLEKGDFVGKRRRR